MKIQFYLGHHLAKQPETKSTDGGNAGYDLYATSREVETDGTVVIGTGVHVAIPKGYVGFLMHRSSNASKDSILANAVGVIDSNYRGEIIAKFKAVQNPINVFPVNEFNAHETINGLEKDYREQFYKVGDKCVQLVIIKSEIIDWEEVKTLADLGETDRGEKGFGEFTGK